MLKKKTNATPKTDATAKANAKGGLSLPNFNPDVRAKAKKAPKVKAEKAEKAAPVPGSLRELGYAWVANLAKGGATQNTCGVYHGIFTYLQRIFGDKPIGSITQKEVEAFIASNDLQVTRSGRSRSKHTINQITRTLRLALGWAVETGKLKASPFPVKAAKPKAEPKPKAKAEKGTTGKHGGNAGKAAKPKADIRTKPTLKIKPKAKATA